VPPIMSEAVFPCAGREKRSPARRDEFDVVDCLRSEYAATKGNEAAFAHAPRNGFIAFFHRFVNES